jgi:hypothetical protein
LRLDLLASRLFAERFKLVALSGNLVDRFGARTFAAGQFGASRLQLAFLLAETAIEDFDRFRLALALGLDFVSALIPFSAIRFELVNLIEQGFPSGSHGLIAVASRHYRRAGRSGRHGHLDLGAADRDDVSGIEISRSDCPRIDKHRLDRC